MCRHVSRNFTLSKVSVRTKGRTGKSEFDSKGRKHFFCSPLGPSRPSVHKSVGRIPSGVELKTRLHLAPQGSYKFVPPLHHTYPRRGAGLHMGSVWFMVYGCLFKYSEDVKTGWDGWTCDRLRQVVNSVQKFRLKSRS